jgi:hypothetical protein
MDSSRALSGVLCLVLFASSTAFLPAAETAQKIRLEPRRAANELSRVEVALQVGGDLRLVSEGKSKNLPMSVVANLKYDEQILALDGARRPSRSVRYYDEARAAIKVDKGGEKPSLDPTHRMIVVDKASKSPAAMFCPTASLRREELDLIELPGNTLLIDRLLPSEAVAAGQSWKLNDEILAELLGLDAVSWSDVDCMLAKADDGLADVAAAGSLNGAVGGVATEIELKIKYKFDRATNRISFLALLIKEKRSVGHVGPGLDTVAKVIITISPLSKSQNLKPEAVRSVPSKPTPELAQLSYSGGSGRFRLQYDRRWYLTSDDSKLAVMRMVERGDLVAQCNLSPLAAQKGPVTLAQFQRDVQASLGKNFGQFVKASESKNEAGYTVLRLVVHGTVSQLPIEWIYYLIEDEKGKGVSLAFTFEQELEGRFGQSDRELVNSLRLVEPVAPTAAKSVKTN